MPSGSITNKKLQCTEQIKVKKIDRTIVYTSTWGEKCKCISAHYESKDCLNSTIVFRRLILFLNRLHLDPRLPEASGSEPGRQDELR